jgi:hypothetical protein
MCFITDSHTLSAPAAFTLDILRTTVRKKLSLAASTKVELRQLLTVRGTDTVFSIEDGQFSSLTGRGRVRRSMWVGRASGRGRPDVLGESRGVVRVSLHRPGPSTSVFPSLLSTHFGCPFPG